MDHNPPGKELLVETQNGICVVKFNRPAQLNAVVRPMHEALAGLWSQFAADPEIDVIVLTGEGRASAPEVTSPISNRWVSTPRSVPRNLQQEAGCSRRCSPARFRSSRQ